MSMTMDEIIKRWAAKRKPALVIEFVLNKPHVIDFVLRNGGFSSVRLQGFVCLWLKPCNFGSAHEAPSTP